MRRLYITILLAALLPSPLLMAQEEALTLERCREMALECNLMLQSSQQQIEASQRTLSAYKANYLPNFSLNGSYLYSTTTFEYTIQGGYLPTYIPDATTGELTPNLAGMSADGTPIFNEYAYMPDQQFDFEVGSVFNAGVQVTQPIYMGGKITTATKLARIGVDVAKLNRRKSETDVILQADNAFYTYQKVNEMYTTATKYHEVVAAFYKQVESAYNNGMGTKNDQLKVQVSLNEAELAMRKAENGLRLARMNLCYTIGLPLTTERLEIVDNFVPTLVNLENVSLDVTNRPEYAMLEKQVEAKTLEAKVTRSDYLPSVSAIANYGYTNGMTLNGTRMVDDAGFTGGVMVSIPLFHWGEGRNKVAASKAGIIEAENKLQDYTQLMTLELMQAINAYDEATLEVELRNRALAQSEENMRLSNNHYQAGMETLTDYLEAQVMWQKSMQSLIEAKAAQRLAYATYLKTAGSL